MASQMIKRVGEAIQEAWNSCSDGWNVSILPPIVLSEAEMTHLARAAIEAMREPTEVMVSANSDAGGHDDAQTIADWRAMIDAALT